eukprot:TRINITY_DN66186_c6_g9_i1.p1 TRINITY_DN66186_c6_g9~~TRINITY_DN66186_c6_g9_i1.p1  ORF type:complete len:874 (+),score=466.42 TRINITY_DN66186_c6_g9_i1:68-2623(+)
MSGGHHHRSAFTSAKKPFKGKSKGALKRRHRGRVDAKTRSRNATAVQSKKDRVNHAKQVRANKRAEMLARARKHTPQIVGIVALGPHANVDSVATMLLKHCSEHEGEIFEKTHPSLVTVRTRTDGSRVKHLTFFKCASRDPTEVLDLGKVADVLLLVITPTPDLDPENVGVDAHGFHLLSQLKAQGLPTCIGLVQGLDKVTNRKHNAAISKLATRYFHSVLDDQPKVLPVDEMKHMQPIFRWLHNHKERTILWRKERPYTLAESIKFVPSADSQDGSGTLMVSGVLRGSRPMSANNLVHITGVGDFQLSHISVVQEERRGSSKHNRNSKDNDQKQQQQSGFKPVALSVGASVQPDPEQVESLESLQPLDPFATTAYDQSVITEEEMAEAEERIRKMRRGKHIQSVWEDGLADVLSDNDNDDDDDDGEMKDDYDEDELAVDETMLTQANADPSKDMDLAKRRELEKDEQEFPDEVEVPLDTPAEVRFQKYRGLKSFSKSPWDKFESLPVEYSRIYSFQDFVGTQKRVMNKDADEVAEHKQQQQEQQQSSMDVESSSSSSGSNDNNNSNNNNNAPNNNKPEPKGAPKSLESAINERAAVVGPHHVASGSRVVLHLINVPAAIGQQLATATQPVCVWSLFQFERKVSVLHFLVRRYMDDVDIPIKGKDEMVCSVGFRRFVARPIYSYNNKGANKHMTSKFFMKGKFMVASVYGRIMFGAAPVLMWRKNRPVPSEETPNVPATYNPLAATGSLLSVDPHRMLIKRIILTGDPIRVHKRGAVVRYMFFNPQDVNYFKPVELRTKFGLTGHIRDSIGTHGYMKCLFNGYIKQHDTVCMHLYKRQFPKFDEAAFQGNL